MYTVDYYLTKFRNTRDDKWNIGHLQKEGASCANGWCGAHIDPVNGKINVTEESKGLVDLFSDLQTDYIKDDHWAYSRVAAFINNGDHPLYPQPHPKYRILAALRDIKKMKNAIKTLSFEEVETVNK